MTVSFAPARAGSHRLVTRATSLIEVIVADRAVHRLVAPTPVTVKNNRYEAKAKRERPDEPQCEFQVACECQAQTEQYKD